MKKIIFTFAVLLLFVSLASSQYGYKWVLKPSGTMSNLYCASLLNNTNNGYICGSNGTILFSSDLGNTWIPKSTGINIDLSSISNINSYPIVNIVVCCGVNGTILISTNTGNNWSQLNSGTSVKLNCILPYGQMLFAVGNNGIIIKSTWSNGSYSSFSQIPSGTNKNLNSFFSGFNFFICGDNGTVLKSTNQGANWISVSIPISQNLNSIYVNNDSDVFVCGNNGVYYKSTNYGQSWFSEPTGITNNLNCLERTFNNNGPNYMVGSSGIVLYNPSSWYSPIWLRKNISTSVDLNYIFRGNNFFTIGSNGTIYKLEMDSALWTTNINANSISTYMFFRGIFDQDKRIGNLAGFEWPKGSNKRVVFTSGLSASCRINGQLAQTMCSYTGEYQPGAIINGQFNDSDIFKIYKVNRAENPPGSDWFNWGCMVPYGAPFVDVNYNGIYEPLIDTPGVKNATQTIFVCLTDFNPYSHNFLEGFGGGVTSPLMGIELHLTKWSYTYPSFNDVTFSKFEIINKGGSAWNKTYFAIISDPDVGEAIDDWVGCDTVRNMGYGYNGDDNDPLYGAAPPAVGFDILKGPINKRVWPNVIYNMSTFIRFVSPSANPPCESDPGEPNTAYLMLQGFKKDSSVWLDKTQPTPWGSYKRTKKIFYGDPETNEGWTSAKGYIRNCGLDTIGVQSNEVPGDKRIVIGMGADNYTMYNGDTAVIWLAQLVARGTSNLNSVTKLKQLSDITQTFFESNFTIGINKISSEIPERYSLSQNYPNPFNPVTKIKYSITNKADVKLIVYDVLGRKVTELVNEKQTPGVYEISFDGTNFSSGVYFCRLSAGNFSDTKKMLMIK